MKKLPIFLLAFVFALSCTETPTLSSEVQNFNESDLSICQNDDCPKIALDYPVYSGEGTVYEQLNKNIQTYLIACLHLGEDEPTATTLEEVAMEFIQANNDLKTEFDMALNYEAQATVKEAFRNENVITLEKRSYLFTGGAHGYGSVHFTHFDLKTGEELRTTDLFENMPGFTTTAEEVFRKAQGLPEEGSINANGFWFEDDRFHLPDSIGLTNEGIVLIYNQYDIASYADGPIEVTITWDDARPYLSKIYFP